MKRHRWGEKRLISPHKSEQACRDCGIIKVSRCEWAGGHPLYWSEFWRGLDQITCEGTPACEPVEVSA